MSLSLRRLMLPVVAIALLTAACAGPAASPTAEGPITVYSGRSEELVGPLLAQFTAETGIEVQVRYGDTAEFAAQILTEGANSPADVFFAQDAGALGALAREEMLATLPDETLNRVDPRFRSPEGLWVGVSGRARVVVYNTDHLAEADLPDTILGFADPEWEGRIGWAPTNGSFQAFVTALRITEGDEVARDWLEGILANNPKVYEGNNPALDAVGAGEVDVAFINHYYLARRQAEVGGTYPAANYFIARGEPGALVNVAGAGILSTSDQTDAARSLVNYLLSTDAQQYFAEQTYEYPLVEGVAADPALPPLSEIETPEIDLSDLADLEGTLELLRDVGIL